MLCHFQQAGANDSNALSIDRSTDTPDLMQSNPNAGLPYGGQPYCGAVAAANSMVWLSKNGYPKLAPEKAYGDVKAQGLLALKLAKAMKTTRYGGTVPDGFLVGLEQYVKASGYKIDSLKYQGWEKRPKRCEGGSIKPQLSFLEQGIADPMSVAWIKIGWYKYFPKKDKYLRFAGHWVTLVGIKRTAGGDNDSSSFVIHDPAPRSGTDKTNEVITVTKISHGKLWTGYDGDKCRDANGFYSVGGQVKIKEKADCGVIDGIVVLKLK